MRESGVDLGTIGLFALVGTPYTVKFLWAPLTDALDVPLLGRWLGRRRGWLVFTQILLMAAIVFLGSCNPAVAPGLVAFGALLVSTAGALFLVSAIQAYGLDKQAAWHWGYVAMAALVLIGTATALIATEPERSRQADAAHAHQKRFARVAEAAVGAFKDFLGYEFAFAMLAFVVLFKFTDALSGAMTAPFVIDLGFTRNEYAAIVKGVGLAALLAGGFAGGFVARALPLATSLWIGGILQAVANLAFSWLAVVGTDPTVLAIAITVENFTSAIGTVIFVAYLSALCRNPLHTATQYALLTALAAVGRTYLSSGAGYVAKATGWPLFFAICVVVAVPSLILLAWLQRRGHFETLEPVKV